MNLSRRFPLRLVRRTSLFTRLSLSLVACAVVLFQLSSGFPKPVGARATRDAIEARALESKAALMPEGNGYTYSRSISIDHTKVPNTDQSNFPLLISGTYSYLATVANGGRVQNSSGYDIIFTSDSACATKLNHEVESYSAATGAARYWVKVPTVSHTSDTVIYMCYGNASITTSQENKNGVWDSYFLNVLHFGDGTTFNGTDSTSDGNTGTLESPASAATGKIGGALYSNTGDVARAHGYNHGSNNVTISSWVKTSDKVGVLDEYGTNNDLLYVMVGDPFGFGSAYAHKASIFFGEVNTYVLYAAIGTSNIDDGNWHHVCAVRDESNKQLRIYVDGNLEATTAYSGLSTSNPSGINSRIGLGLGFGLANIDEYRESHTSRSSDWIKTEYNNQNSPATFYAISAASGNQAPVANAGGSYSGVTGTAVNFSGSSSSDPDGTIASYSWNFGDSNSGSGATPTHTYTTAGTYTVTLTVTDNLGATNSASTTATISNRAPVANAGGAYTGVTGTAVSFNGSNSSDPDGTIANYSWNFGDNNSGSGATPTHTYATAGTYTVTLTVTDNLGATNSASATVTVTGILDARLDPLNRTGGGGEDPLSRNFNWSIPLMGLPGRGGLDLGLSLAYNSLATWTRNGNAISFDDDRGSPSPGFRLGFPVIQGTFYNSQAGKNSFVMITPSGSRVELRQVGTSTRYQSVDSSYLLLDSTTMTLRTTDGTQLSYVWKGGDYECAQIKDRNGNYLTINYDTSDRIDTIVDTLSRTITFNYDSNGLSSITQTWAGQTHYWARFTYANKTIQTNFTALTVYGPANNSTIHALTQVKFADDSHFDFDYTSWGQVWKISQYTGETTAHLLNYRSYNLPADNSTGQTDCPRFTVRHDWAENWNRDTNGTAQEVNTTFAAPVDAALPDNSLATVTKTQVTSPDGTYQQVYFAGNISGGAGSAPAWKRGLPLLTDTFDNNNTKQRSATTAWTQDDTTVTYQFNPRVTETNISDPAGNHARTSIDYAATTLSDGTTINLPQNTYEYQADATTQLRRTHVAYNLASDYTSRRIIGLASEQTLYGGPSGSETLLSKVSYQYDETGSIQGTDAPVKHDNTNYPATFRVGRGNVSSVKRYDVSGTGYTTSTMQYNTAGGVVATLDPLSHGVTISYADSFSDDGNSRNTLAYPTTVTDYPAGFSSSMKYNFDFGAATRKQTPLPNVTDNEAGPVQTIEYDSLGRPQKVKNLFNSAYTRYEYPASQNRVDTYVTIVDTSTEAHSFKITDGHGRVIASASDHPGSTGGFSGQLTYYDTMGRVVKTSNPTETNASSSSGNPYDWPTAGDDAQAGWVYSQQSYDWKGRPLTTTNTDSTTKSASYGGCGCAGGQVVTLTDEVGRQQKVYGDVLGRQWKTEVLNSNSSVYSTSESTFNARDQVTQVRQFQGVDTSGVYQETTMSYDGYGRLHTKHVPEQNSSTATTWDYNNDDTTNSVTDARGASATYGYNNRRLVTGITYSAPTGVATTPDVTFAYDAVGNRTAMTDGIGSASYSYDTLSRLTSETRTFNGVGTYTLSYDYNLGGLLKSITDPFGAQIGYIRDNTGRITSVTGSGFLNISTYASNIQYRAWGGQKSVTYGDGTSATTNYNGRMQPSSYQLPGLREQFQYYADGRLQQMTDLDDRNQDIGYPDTARHFSVAHSYDQVGRLVSARGLPPAGLPYNQSYGYDAFGNSTSRSGGYYYQNYSSDGGTIQNNRRQDLNYDADGNVTHTPSYNYAGGSVASFRDWAYDAAGQMTQVKETVTANNSVSTYISSYDGDGQLTIEYFQENSASKSFAVRSSVLGGKVLTRLDNAGNKSSTVFDVDGLLTAVQNVSTYGSSLRWTHIDPLGLSEAGDTKPVYDPMGNYIQWQHAPTAPPNAYPPIAASFGGLGPSFGYAINSACILDGIPTDCTLALNNLAHGSAAQCPNNDCSPQPIPYIDPDTGKTGSAGWLAFNGSGVWASDGTTSDYLDPDDIQSGSALDAYAMYLTPQEKKKGRGRRRRVAPLGGIVSGVAGDSLFSRITIEGFDAGQKAQIKGAIGNLFTDKCADAYHNAHLRSPEEIVRHDGLVVRPSYWLGEKTAQELGIVNDVTRQALYEGFYKHTAWTSSQGGTIPAFGEKGSQLTTDGRTQIYLHTQWAFQGEDPWNFSLQDVMSHEFIHGNPTGQVWGRLGRLRHDLAGFAPHDAILAACR